MSKMISKKQIAIKLGAEGVMQRIFSGVYTVLQDTLHCKKHIQTISKTSPNFLI